MKVRSVVYVVIGSLMVGGQVWAQPIDYLQPVPLLQAVTERLQPVSVENKIRLITWGGDVATILGEMEGIFQREGVAVTLEVQNDFKQQVIDVLTGKTPYLRGTMGMINAATELFAKYGIALEVVCQLTWSTGGDAMVIRSGKNLKNIKTVALQLYGPHMDYAANLFQNAGRLNQVTFKYLKELTLPTYETSRVVDPVSAFQTDAALDAVMCIIPDALMLTSGGKVGTGAEGSVKGATILLSTKTASRIIADVYAVRSDYKQGHPGKVEKFAHAVLVSEEALRDLRKSKGAKYSQLLSKSADLLLGSTTSTADVEAMLSDCEFAGYNGNVAFLTGKGTTRTLETLTREIQTSFITMGLLGKRVPLADAGLDFANLASGLKYASVSMADVPKSQPKFDPARVAKKVESKIAVEPTSWETEGTLFVVEINFEANQSDFPVSQYASDFQKAVEIAQTYSGSLIVIEGHSDPLGILKAQQQGEKQQVVQQMKQQAKNLSLERAQVVRGGFLNYAKNKGLVLDESQFVAVGLGTESPKFNPPRTKEEWAANRRVVFRIKEVEAELREFVPLN